MIENVIPEDMDDYTTNDYVNYMIQYLVITMIMILGIIGLLWLVHII